MSKKLTPKERRLIRQEENLKGERKKKASLLSRPEFKKIPRSAYSFETSKTPKAHKNPESIMQMTMRWCRKCADVAGEWSWGQERQWSQKEWDETIEPFLKQFERLKWAEIYNQLTGEGKKSKRRKKHHDMDVCDLCDEAVERWKEIGLEEFETSFRFRLGGTERLWGYRIKEKFKIVWWDPFHNIFPL